MKGDQMNQYAVLKCIITRKEERGLLVTVENCDDSVVVRGTYPNGDNYAIMEISQNGVYLFGGFPSDFPIAIDPKTKRIAVTSS